MDKRDGAEPSRRSPASEGFRIPGGGSPRRHEIRRSSPPDGGDAAGGAGPDIVATAMPTIGLDLGDASNLPWIVTAYLLASTAVTPLYGKLSDIHGRRVMLLIAIAIFSLGSLACALAPTMIGLALARAFRASAAAGSSPCRRRSSPTSCRLRSGRAIRSTSPGSSPPPRWPGPCSGASSPSICTGRDLLDQPADRFLAFWLTNDKLKLLPRHERRHRLDYPGAALLVLGSTACCWP